MTCNPRAQSGGAGILACVWLLCGTAESAIPKAQLGYVDALWLYKRHYEYIKKYESAFTKLNAN